VTQASRLTSRQHPIVKRFRQLASGRDDDGRWVLLDGEHLIADAIAASVRIDTLLTDGRRSAVVRQARAAGADVIQGTTAVLEAASPVRTPSGVVAIAEWRTAPIESVFARAPALVIGLVGVQDPGNVGSVIRATHALGATGVLTLDGTANPTNWKALRGSTGSVFRVPIGRGSLAEAAAAARAAGVRIAATVAAGGESIEQADLIAPVLVLLGNEGAGLSNETVEQADLRLTIPMQPDANSLNVSVAAALVLFEARRQRRSGGR
jgi:RNA methyltransferase, TrmH family